MVTTGSEDAWQRKAFISIESSSTVKMQYEALTETIDIDNGERGFDMIQLLNLGQIPKHGPLGVFTITFEGYPLQAGTADTSGATRGTPKGGLSTGYWELFSDAGHADTSQPLDLDMTNTLTRYRVAILWTDEEDATGTSSAASDATPSITGTSATSGVHDGKMITLTSGTASGGRYMIVSGEGTSVYTLTTGDTPQTDMGSGSPTDTYTISPTGSGATSSGAKARRFVIADCNCVSCKSSFTDGILKQTLIFKGVAFDKSEAKLVKAESDDGSAILPELGDYTAGTTRWA